MSEKSSIKVGIVGTGNVARSNYLPFLSRQEDVSLVYYSRTRSKAEACAREFGGRVVGSVAGRSWPRTRTRCLS